MPAKLHPAWVKNILRRVLWAAFEDDLTKDERILMVKHFKRRCAYCGRTLKERWHADHILSVDQGGYNHISNRVPACARCNEREKREMKWSDFLRTKCGDNKSVFLLRRQQIRAWMAKNRPAVIPVSGSQRKSWKKEVDLLSPKIDKAWARLKRLKKHTSA
jgi:hypothetical protein